MTWLVFVLIRWGVPLQLACAGTTGQPVEAERCDGFLVVGEAVLPVWRGEP
jgi:hypothetical protein